MALPFPQSVQVSMLLALLLILLAQPYPACSVQGVNNVKDPTYVAKLRPVTGFKYSYGPSLGYPVHVCRDVLKCRYGRLFCDSRDNDAMANRVRERPDLSRGDCHSNNIRANLCYLHVPTTTSYDATAGSSNYTGAV
jgi:hypothetical protein